MTILAIDPGNEYSAWVVYHTEHSGRVGSFGKEPNGTLLAAMMQTMRVDHVVCEMIACYGMPVGREVFETCRWIGRFEQAAHMVGTPFSTIYRQDVKLHLCGSPRAKDPNVRQALLDRFGGKSAVGKKKTPGPLYGVSGDVWAALGVAVTWAETKLPAEAAA